MTTFQLDTSGVVRVPHLFKVTFESPHGSPTYNPRTRETRCRTSRYFETEAEALAFCGGQKRMVKHSDEAHRPYSWSDLPPFTQGFIEAMFASLSLFHLECPACEWDCIVGPPGVGDLGLCCPLCAADNGRDVRLRTVGGERDLPATVEGRDARASVRFDALHPATLARIIEDCERDQRQGFNLGNGEDRETVAAGRLFWAERQTGNLFDCPPLTPYLGDDGKVYLREGG